MFKLWILPRCLLLLCTGAATSTNPCYKTLQRRATHLLRGRPRHSDFIQEACPSLWHSSWVLKLLIKHGYRYNSVTIGHNQSLSCVRYTGGSVCVPPQVRSSHSCTVCWEGSDCSHASSHGRLAIPWTSAPLGKEVLALVHNKTVVRALWWSSEFRRIIGVVCLAKRRWCFPLLTPTTLSLNTFLTTQCSSDI